MDTPQQQVPARSHGRMLLMFSMVIIAAIGFVLFTFSYRQLTHERLIEYVEAITDCRQLIDEQTCVSHVGCESIYETTCSDCTDHVFVRCVEIDGQRAEQLKREEQLCDETGGRWYRNELGHFCLCDAVAPTASFKPNQGCSI
jgi:hypothetical protein